MFPSHYIYLLYFINMNFFLPFFLLYYCCADFFLLLGAKMYFVPAMPHSRNFAYILLFLCLYFFSLQEQKYTLFLRC